MGKIIRNFLLPVFLCLGMFSSDISAAQLKFSWDANPEKVNFYVLYYGSRSNKYTKRAVTSNISWTVENFRMGYYYARVAAFNNKGIVGPRSEEIEFKVGRRGVTTVPPSQQKNKSVIYSR